MTPSRPATPAGSSPREVGPPAAECPEGYIWKRYGDSYQALAEGYEANEGKCVPDPASVVVGAADQDRADTSASNLGLDPDEASPGVSNGAESTRKPRAMAFILALVLASLLVVITVRVVYWRYKEEIDGILQRSQLVDRAAAVVARSKARLSRAPAPPSPGTATPASPGTPLPAAAPVPPARPIPPAEVATRPASPPPPPAEAKPVETPSPAPPAPPKTEAKPEPAKPTSPPKAAAAIPAPPTVVPPPAAQREPNPDIAAQIRNTAIITALATAVVTALVMFVLMSNAAYEEPYPHYEAHDDGSSLADLWQLLVVITSGILLAAAGFHWSARRLSPTAAVPFRIVWVLVVIACTLSWPSCVYYAVHG